MDYNNPHDVLKAVMWHYQSLANADRQKGRHDSHNCLMDKAMKDLVKYVDNTVETRNNLTKYLEKKYKDYLDEYSKIKNGHKFNFTDAEE